MRRTGGATASSAGASGELGMRACHPLLVGVAACLLFLIVVGLILWHTRTDALVEAQRNEELLGRALADETAAVLSALEVRLAPELQRYAQPAAWQEPPQQAGVRLQALVQQVPALAGVAAVDLDGSILHASTPAASAARTAEVRAFFRAYGTEGERLRAAPAPAPLFGERSVWLVHRVEGADGRILGHVAFAVRNAYLHELYRSGAGEKSARIRLYGPGKTVVFEHVAGAVHPGYGSAPHLAVAHAVHGFPLLIETAVPYAVALGEWRRTAAVTGSIGALGALLLGLLGALNARQSGQHAADKARLRENQEMLQQTQHIAHVGSLSYEMHTGKVQCSEEARRILALEPADSWRRHEVLSRVHPADRRVLVHALITCRRGGHADVELRVGFRRHYERWVLVRTALPDAAGAPVMRAAIVDITERKAAEVSRAQLAAIVESTEDAVMSMTPEGVVLAWNRAAQRLFGYSAGEVMGRNISALLPPDQTADTSRLLALVAGGRSIEHYDTVRRAKHGDDIHVALTVSPILDERDRISAVSFMARDVTAQKKSQMRRNVEHAVMRALLESDAMDEAMLRVIRTLCQALGWDYGARWMRQPGEHRAERAEWWCTPPMQARLEQGAGDVALFPHLVQRVWETGWTVLRQDLALDPEFEAVPEALRAGLRCALVFPIRSHGGTIGVLQFLTRELRDADAELLESADMIGSQLGQYIERQRAERERIEADARLQRIMANIPDAVFQFRRAPDGTFSFPFISERVADLYGERPADVVRDHTLVFAPVADPQRRELAKSMLRSKRTGQPWSFETLVRCRNGVRRWIRGQASVSYGSDGSVYWDGVLSDITAQKRAALDILTLNEELEQRVNERTRQLEAINQELEAFSYSVSHDLRVPLRAMEGYTRLLQDQYGERLDDNARHYVDRVLQAARRMSELVDDLLQLSRISRSELKLGLVDLSAMARDILRALAEDAPHRCVQLEVEPDIAVQGDPRLLRIVLENLLGNAWKFTQHTPQPAVAFGRRQADGETVLYVRDNGAGFDMKRAHKLFGAFQRLHRSTDFEGHGIGLATVRRIVNLHGGRVWGTGEVNAGATFCFTLSPAPWGR